MSLFLEGLALGFAIAAPVGPIGVLCIRRTLAEGFASGFATGLGAATADAVYGSAAGFGVTIVSQALLRYEAWLRLAGGLFLCYLAVRTFFAPVAERPAAGEGKRLAGAYASTLLLTLTNPVTIISFLAAFSGLGLAGAGGDPSTALHLVSGVFLGSTFWWLLLASGVSVLRARVTPRTLRWVNRASGGIIGAFGVLALAGLKG